jgi:hypothetical protein
MMSDQNRINNGEFGTGMPAQSRIKVTRNPSTGKFDYQMIDQVPVPPQAAPAIQGIEQVMLDEGSRNVWQDEPTDYPGNIIMPERQSKKRLRHQRIGQAIMFSAVITGSWVGINTSVTLAQGGEMPNYIEDATQFPNEAGESIGSVGEFASATVNKFSDPLGWLFGDRK